MITEQEFLQQQAQRAKQRFVEELRGLGRDLVDPLDPRPTVRRRPFTSLAVSLAGGLLAGLGLGGIRWQRWRDRPRRAKAAPAKARADRAPQDGATSSWGTLLKRGRSLLRIALTTAAFVRRGATGTAAAPTATNAPVDDGVPIA